MLRDYLTRALSDVVETKKRARTLGNADDAAISFSFENQQLKARAGQSVAAALLANDIRMLRIDEAGNPKGILCGIGYCFECRCVIDDEPDQRACMVEVEPGMRVQRQQGLA